MISTACEAPISWLKYKKTLFRSSLLVRCLFEVFRLVRKFHDFWIGSHAPQCYHCLFKHHSLRHRWSYLSSKTTMPISTKAKNLKIMPASFDWLSLAILHKRTKIVFMLNKHTFTSLIACACDATTSIFKSLCVLPGEKNPNKI